MAATGDRVPCVWVENERVVGLDPTDSLFVSYRAPFEGEPLGSTHPELLTKLHPSPNHGHNQAVVNGISRIGYMKGGHGARWEDENIADSITEHAVGFIKDHADEPFFLYLGTNDIHVPRYPHPRFVGKSGMGPRGDAILQFDYTVGAVLDALEQEGIADNTLIILTSDNGPVVDDGYADQAVELLGNHRPWGSLRGGKYSNFEAGTRVPLIVSWPRKVKSGVSGALISHIDLFASMAALLDVSPEVGAGVDSRNALPALLGNDSIGREYVIEKAGSISVYDGEWKYIAPSNGSAYNRLTNIELGNSRQPQLYHISTDLGEQHNVASEYPHVVERMKKIIADNL
jgi:arylsulfatase A-like enzyme